MTFKYRSWTGKTLEKDISDEVWNARCVAEILSAPSTARLIKQAAGDKEINYLTTKIDKKLGSRIFLHTDSVYVDYEEIIDDPGVSVDGAANYISVNRETNVGYVVLEQQISAKVPDDIRNLLISTGNLTVEYVKCENVNCSI